MLHFDDIVNLTYTISRLVLGLMERIESAARMTFVNHFFLYFSATSHSQHTAGLNVSGSFLLGVIYAMPAVDTNKINQLQSGVAGKPLDRFQGLTPRAKLMLGVGYVVQLLSLVFVGCLLILLSVNISHNTTFISLSLLDNYFITFSGLTSYEKLLWQVRSMAKNFRKQHGLVIK